MEREEQVLEEGGYSLQPNDETLESYSSTPGHFPAFLPLPPLSVATVIVVVVVGQVAGEL